MHPAFKSYLSQAVESFGPVIAELAGLPGVPVRAVEIPGQALPPRVQAANADGFVPGTPPAYEFSMDGALTQVPDAAQFQDGFRQDIVHAVDRRVYRPVDRGRRASSGTRAPRPSRPWSMGC